MLKNQLISPTKIAKEVVSLVFSYQKGQPVDPIAELQFAESPENFSFLLQLANGDSEALAISTSLSQLDDDVLKMSAINYLAHYCFDIEKDPWQVLGLNKRTSSDEVKRRYYQMIKLFHPDRALLELVLLQSYAVKINRAYQLIKKQNALAAIDLPSKDVPQKHGVFSKLNSSLPFNGRLTGRFLFVLVMLGLLTIFLKFNIVDHEILISDRPLIEDQQNNFLLEDKTKIDIAEQVDVSNKPEGQETNQAEHDPQLDHKLPIIKPRVMTNVSNIVTNKIKNKETEQNQAPALLESNNHLRVQSSYQESIDNFPVGTKVNQIPSQIKIEEPLYVAPTTISQKDLKLMIIKLMDAYNQGSLEVLMTLMADNITVNGSAGKEDLRLTYGMLFAKSKQRDMVLRDVRWQINGNTASGTMGYIAQIKKNGDSSFEVHQGMFNLDVALLNERLKIIDLQTIETNN